MMGGVGYGSDQRMTYGDRFLAACTMYACKYRVRGQASELIQGRERVVDLNPFRGREVPFCLLTSEHRTLKRTKLEA